MARTVDVRACWGADVGSAVRTGPRPREPPGSFHGRRRQIIKCRRSCRSSIAKAMPIRIVESFAYESVEARTRPSVETLRQPVLDRIVVNVVAVSFVFHFITDRMLPEASLPHAAPPVLAPAVGDRLLTPGDRQPRLRERLFQEGPATGEVAVAVGQRPNGMQVVRQHDDRTNLERPARGRRSQRFAQASPGVGLTQGRKGVRKSFGHFEQDL